MAVQVANLLAQIGADLTQFRQGMSEVDARLAATGSRAVTAFDRINGMRMASSKAAAEAVRFTDASTKAGQMADKLVRRIQDARTAQADSINTLKTQAAAQATLIGNAKQVALNASKELENQANATAAKITATGLANKRLAAELRSQASVIQNDVGSQVRLGATKADASRRRIEDIDNNRTVALANASQLAQKAGTAAIKGQNIQALKLTAQAELQRNRADELARQHTEEIARQASRSADLTSKIAIAGEKANKLRQQALALETGGTDQMRKLVEAEKKLRDKAAKLASHDVEEIKRLERGLDTIRGKITTLSAGDTPHIQTLVERQDKYRGRQSSFGRRSQELQDYSYARSRDADNAQRDTDANDVVARNYTNRLAENAREHQVRAVNNIAQSMQTAGTVIEGGLIAAIGAGSRFNEMLLLAQNNTSLVGAEAQVMNDAIKRLGLESGGALDQIAAGYQKVENFSFNAADAAKITQAAMESSISTGSNMANTSELLAKVIVQFGMSADDASVAMNTMHVAANLSSLEMEQLVSVGGQTYSMAANLGISFTEANAALVTFTKQGLNAHESMTQFRNDVQKIVSPTKEVQKRLEDLKKITGVDLPKAFSYTSLKTEGLTGAFAKIREAAKKGGYDPKQLANQLFPNLRGTIGAMIMSSDQGFNQFRDTVGKLDDAMKGKVDPTTKQYANTLKLTETQLKRARNAMTLLTADINSAAAPAVIDFTNAVRKQLEIFSKLPDSTKSSIVQITMWGGAIVIATALVLKFIVGVASMNAAFLAATGAQTFAQGLGLITTASKAFIATNIVAISTIGAITGVIAIAGIGLIALAQYVRDANEAEARYTAELKKSSEESEKSTAAKYREAHSTNELLQQVKVLADKTNKTKEEKQLLRDLMNKIANDSPQYIKSYDDMGNAIFLTGEAAKTAAQHFAEMGKQAAIAQSRATLTGLQPTVDRRAIINDRLNAIKQMKDANEVWARREAPWHAGDTQTEYEMGRVQAGTLGPAVLKAAKDAMAREVRELLDERKRLDAIYKAGMNRSKIQVNGGDLTKIIKAPTRPKPTNVDQALNEYHAPGKEKKEKKVKDPADEWRRYILGVEESMFKLNNLDPLADAKWMKQSDSVEKKLEQIKDMGKLYRLAADGAERLTIMQKRAAEQKTYSKEMERLLGLNHKPASERLGDIARWEVGDPTKDKWKVNFLTSPLGDPNMPAKVVHRPEFLTGNDPQKKMWLPNQKQNYILESERQQRLKDHEVAVKQIEDLQKKFDKPLEKQMSIFDQAFQSIVDQTEAYAELGFMGASVMASIAQSTYDAAMAQKALEDAAKQAAEDYAKNWEKATEAFDEVRAKSKILDMQTDGFGQQISDQARESAMALDLFGKQLEDLDPVLQIFTMMIAGANKGLEKKEALKEYTDQIRELEAEFRSIVMVGGDFQKWLMKTTGQTEESIRAMGGTFNHLDIDQYRNIFNKQTDVDQAQQLDGLRDSLKQTRIEMGLITFKTLEAKVAWETFHKTFESLSPEIQNDVRKITAELAKMDKIRKMQRIWRTAADTLEDAFGNAFESVLNKTESFWDAFANTIKSAVISIIASEAAKEMVRFIGKLTGWSSLGKYGEEGKSPTNVLPTENISQPAPIDPLSVAATVAGIFINKNKQAGGEHNPVDSILQGLLGNAQTIQGQVQNVFLVGIAPGISMGGGIPGMPGQGGIGGALGTAAGGMISGKIGGALGSFGGPIGILAGGLIGGALGKLLKFGNGGRPAPHIPAIIGDGGPEIWVPDRPGRIYPNGDLEDLMNGTGGSGSGISVINTGDNHYYTDTDAELVAQKTANKIDRKIRLRTV